MPLQLNSHPHPLVRLACGGQGGSSGEAGEVRLPGTASQTLLRDELQLWLMGADMGLDMSLRGVIDSGSRGSPALNSQPLGNLQPRPIE
ncbi:hypothetical protein chiPu_0012942 [Chiloscyllium punctatum]|uniref:Uncharacterized protein n=1 Tax=Chiloscyllium punctatum TaxID=137246 RepID=A0A401SVR1_CHIPU|nr:hypothetical protein [Chiloscyllium punctatum]